jgi:phosphate-selective porin
MIQGNRRGAVVAGLLASCVGMVPVEARAEDQAATIASLQKQIDELRGQVQALLAAKAAGSAPVAVAAPLAMTPATPPAAPVALAAAVPVPAKAPAPAPAPAAKKWYDRLQLRGYVQLRSNELLSGDGTAPAGVSRLRSVHDTGVGEKGNFAFRRVRLVVQGDVSDKLGIYIQSDLAGTVSNQSNGERRDNFAQLRDAYADLYLANRTVKLRFGQSKVPYGWENLQSSSNRLSIDRADAANSAVPGERDIGVVAYYTPPAVQKIWDDLTKDGQKLFGTYGAFGLGAFNGQGINRMEKNDGLMTVALATWPFRLDGLGAPFKGQVLELGVQGLHNSVQPELRTGGVTANPIEEKRVNLHAVLYPNPFGLQAEWNWGSGPEWNPAAQAIGKGNLNGGYVQGTYRIKHSPVGQIMPYARWQSYSGGWKAATNAPRISTDEVELGVEWQPLKELELTVAYAKMKRAEADERRSGVARGDLIRTQLQFNY